jgi:hypothetical protein
VQHAPEKRKGPPPASIRGNDAILAELLYCRWRPSERDVVACLLELDRVTKGGLLATLYRETMGLGRLEDLSVALQDSKAIESLAQDHELFDRCSEKAGFTKAAQMLRRFCFEHSSPPYKKLRDKLPLNVSTAAELWRQLDLSELLQVSTEESMASAAESEPGQLKICFKAGRMDDAHWKDLAEKAPRITRALHKPLPLLKRRASRGYFTLKDWGRLVAAMVVPERQTLDVEASLEHLSSLWNDGAEYCASLAALDALGHTFANLLNQPTQNEADLGGHLRVNFSSRVSKSKISLTDIFLDSQVIMEEDAYNIAANRGLEAARAELYRLEENSGGDFSEFRQRMLDVLKSVALAISNCQHKGNLHLVRAVAGLLAVDWRLAQDLCKNNRERMV